ncbi:MAG: 50S ribosomal protein L13 [Syntrophales bacterium]|jgi:large subunit ribosomal protein L13|nr:50S ribosomal protein L13 [Syntrophales bacterium]MDD4338672.1 50S ribosomal protein L13 [Syntrophales bacterium]HOG08416.1 50S ribosomal protein L13 [Syntrophales bacterium]HOS76724.1 50S ribosomal protein L13 [Syntrophales bacterium]HPB69681.1 50S ribosomal protein L13 [Syntrophales bacterium]
MKTYQAKKEERAEAWYLVDAEGQVLGRLASEVARRLRGKHKPVYTPHTDTGDFIIVVNCEKILLTGRKLTDKVYSRHSGYPGGIKQVTAGKLLETAPEKVLHTAVRGMLPKNSLGRQMLRKLKIYKGNDHPHQAQCPQTVVL